MPKNAQALARLRKQQFDRAEQALALANGHLEALLAEKEKLREQMRSIEPPEGGCGSRLAAVIDQRRAVQRALEILESRIEAARSEKMQKERSLKEAHIAWEQAKSIESQVVGKILARREREVKNRLDEIASQLFWRERREGKES